MTNAPTPATHRDDLWAAFHAAAEKEVTLRSAIAALTAIIPDLEDPDTWNHQEDPFIGPKAKEVLAHLRLRVAKAEAATIAAGAALDADA